MSDIEVEREGEGFRVRVAEGAGRTTHHVTLDREDLLDGYGSPEAFLQACFRFLLAREPKESILPAFAVSVIPRYFPEFEAEIRR